MKKILIAVLVLALLVGGIFMLNSIQRSRARKALAAYKAQLQQQGEWLTIQDAGYPFTLETNANLENFVALANQLRAKSSLPGTLDFEPQSGPGKLQLIWRLPAVPASDRKAQPISWERLAADCESAADIFAQLRAELEHPPRRFGWNYTNPFASTPKNPFVEKRMVAQFFAADTLTALHEGKLPRAQSNLHALTQLAQVHRDDFTLVSAMIRVAVSGLALSTTAQALAADEWDEAGLAALQRDWEALELAQALETGMVGERLFGLTAFARVREAASDEQVKLLMYGAPASGGFEGVKEFITGTSVSAYWRAHMEEDELFYLRHMHERLELIRQLRTNAAGFQLKAEITARMDEYERVMSAPLARYQYLFSGIAIPNYGRAFDTTVQKETHRRLTITAIALQRHHLRQGRHPDDLAQLVPEFLAVVPVDPWSGEPLRYRLNPDGTFTLYSVGMDGVDDGGDPAPADKVESHDLWSGKDAVWPAVDEHR